VPTGGTTGQVLAKASAADFATAWVPPAAGGAQLLAAVITVPWGLGGGQRDHQQTVAVPGLTVASRMAVSLAAVPDLDDNDVEELEAVLLSASYSAADLALISASFPVPVTGPVNLILTVV
jgi:hypothetical protein